MTQLNSIERHQLARIAGVALLLTIVIGIAASIFISKGIDINLSADIEATAQNMLAAESRLMAKAYLGVLMFCLEAAFCVALYLLLRREGPFLAGWSLFASLAAAVLVLLGAVAAANASQLAGNAAFSTLASDSQRLLLAGLQATNDYTSFHLSIILSSLAKAGFFYLFFKSRLIPLLISGWGIFASLFVATTIVARDFVPALGHMAVTMSFMLSNLLALAALSLYLILKGVRA
ncbi:MAG: DUF4386 domain-containing protein [Pseudomonadota bacterium]